MTTADEATARDHAKAAVSLVRMLTDGSTTDAQTLLDGYANSNDQSSLCGSLAMVAAFLCAYADRMAHDLVGVKPDYPISNSADVLKQFELFMSLPADDNAAKESNRGVPISYL